MEHADWSESMKDAGWSQPTDGSDWSKSAEGLDWLTEKDWDLKFCSVEFCLVTSKSK